MKFGITIVYIFILSQSIIIAQSSGDNLNIKDGKLISLLAGNWEGTATAYFEREEEREPRFEEVSVNCETVLKDTYAKCYSVWTTPQGISRELLIFWNYDVRSENYEILFLYDNWPGKVNYKLDFDEEKKLLNGYDTFTASGGVAAEEKVTWQISQDGNEIRSTEYNHYETDPDDYWAKSFEFVWRRVE